MSTLLIVIAVLTILQVGCSIDRWAEVEPGEYAIVDTRGEGTETAARIIQKVYIDRKHDQVTFKLNDGSELISSFLSRERKEWPSGCPSNIGSTRMETLDIEMDSIEIGAITFNTPIMVRNCPPNPNVIVLREDGKIGGSGSACTDKCILFRLLE